MNAPDLVGGDGAALGVAQEVAGAWHDAGLSGAFLARHLGTGAEIGIDVDRQLPLASLVKLPLALAVLDAAARGELGPRGEAEPVEVDPATATRGRTGFGAFRHPATVALGDLVDSVLTVSDNAAADLLFDRLPPERVSAALAGWGLTDPAGGGIVVRHRLRDLHDAAAAAAPDEETALALAVRAATEGGGHAIAMLDVAAANVGSARAVADLLAAVWSDAVAAPEVCARVRDAMRRQLTSHRIAPELATDAVRVATKTGSFLNLRHDAAVVEAGEQTVVVVALTESRVLVTADPGADLAIGRAARWAFEALRD
ncbi:serine hydrolase [uncultured Nocardioides sp.]|uniref:serine hydrolase n=1 Tax=uncultured Nocardioides sp. TaxID=198441 RepID=UPI00262D27BA|nr:serine hydrolase [uncultured Nocardioides sp.]